MHRSALGLIAALVAALSVTGASGEEAGSTVPPEIVAAAGWLGWADAPVAGKGCTAVLVAPDAVLTAAHCVTRDPTVAQPAPRGLIFVPGWGGARAQPPRHGVSIGLPAPRVLLNGRLELDLALVRLDAPVEGIAPLTVAAPGTWHNPVVALGYASADPDRIHRSGCIRALDEPPVYGLDCAAEPGFSGGPVVLQTDAGWQLAAIMVARGTGLSLIGTYALRPSDDLLALLDGK